MSARVVLLGWDFPDTLFYFFPSNHRSMVLRVFSQSVIYKILGRLWNEVPFQVVRTASVVIFLGFVLVTVLNIIIT